MHTHSYITYNEAIARRKEVGLLHYFISSLTFISHHLIHYFNFFAKTLFYTIRKHVTYVDILGTAQPFRERMHRLFNINFNLKTYETLLHANIFYFVY